MTPAAPTANGVPTNARDAALYYLSRGLMPIPVPLKDKDPGRKEWQNLRASADTIDDLFPLGRPLNIGLLNGEPSGGHVDVDADAVEAVIAAKLLLPRTGRISGRPSKPRSHWWYVASEPLKTEQFRDIDNTMLVELRSIGSQTVVAPSLHPSGEPIKWHSFDEPARVDAADLRRAARAMAAAALRAKHWPGLGARHDARNALAGGLLRAGLSEDKAIVFVRAVCTAAKNKDLDDCDTAIRTTVEKLKKGENVTGWPRLIDLLGGDGKKVVAKVTEWLGIKQEPYIKVRFGTPPVKVRTLPPYRPFPVEALPDPLAEYVRQGAAALGCDPAFVALPVIAGAAIGNARALRLKAGWEEPSIFWTAVVADSGTLKSPAYKIGVRYLFRRQKQLIDEFKRAVAAYQEELAAYKERKKEAAEGTDPGEPPEAPVMRRVIVSDTTIEKLGEVLADNPRGVLVARDELSGWLNSFTRYKGKAGGTDLPNWLQLHQAGTIIIDRKTGARPTLYVDPASASVTGGIQPGVIARALTPEFLESGLVARLLPAMPPKRKKCWTEAEIDFDTESRYQRLIDDLLDLEMDGGGEKTPHVLRFSPEAKAVWVGFYGTWAQEQVVAEGDLAAAFSKLEAYAARFTLLHHVVTHVGLQTDDLRPVGPCSVKAGIALCQWFADEDRRIYATLAESDEDREARRLVEFIRSRGDRVTAHDLQRSNSRKYPDQETAEQALDALVQAGLADWTDPPAAATGRRPSRVLVLRPTPDKTDKTPDDDDDDEDDSGDAAPDTTPDTTPPGSGNSRVSDGFVGSVGRRTGAEDGPNGAERAPDQGGGSVGHAEATPGGSVGREPGLREGPMDGGGVYRLVTTEADLGTVLATIDESMLVAIDTETTGLNPRSDRVRLLQIATDHDDVIFLIDCAAVSPAPLWDVLREKTIIGHHLAFDLAFLRGLGFQPGNVTGTLLLSQLVYGTRRSKGFHTLKDAAKRHLNRDLDKAGQQSDWTGTLTEEQLRYAARDAAVLLPLHKALEAEIRGSKQTTAAGIESRCLPAVVWLSSSGVGFDKDAWSALAREAKQKAQALADQLDEAAPPRPGHLSNQGAWNWSSPEQVQQAFALLGIKLESTDDDALAAVNHPLAALLRDYRSAAKLASTYGPKWGGKALEGGRIYAGWWQIGADSGRMACSTPNLQNLPHDERYRRCFVAPPGRVLVKADYSQIELRIAAKVAGDQAMLDAYGRGEDLHTLTARRVLGVEAVTKEQRTLAKALNFGLLYGMGARGFRKYAKAQYGVELTLEQAGSYRDGFFAAYPGLRQWHQKVKRSRAACTRTLGGRRRQIKPDDFDTVRLNSPVQGTGADGLKAALGLLWERRRECPGAYPVLVVHDEIVVECDVDRAEAVAAWLKGAMVDALAPLIAPVPVEVEVKVGRTWGGD